MVTEIERYKWVIGDVQSGYLYTTADRAHAAAVAWNEDAELEDDIRIFRRLIEEVYI